MLTVPSRTVQPSFVYVVPDGSDPEGHTVYLELTPPPEVTYKTSPGSSQQMNVLGIVVFSATMGERCGPAGSGLRGQRSGVTSGCCRSAPGSDGPARSSAGRRVPVCQRVCDEDHQRRRLVRIGGGATGTAYGPSWGGTSRRPRPPTARPHPDTISQQPSRLNNRTQSSSSERPGAGTDADTFTSTRAAGSVCSSEPGGK